MTAIRTGIEAVSNEAHAQYRTALESTLGVPFVDGNQLDVLRNGCEIFPAMLEAIEDAERRIDLLTYIYWTGRIAERFATTLARKAREGVRVRLLLDAFGSKKISRELLRSMDGAGVEIRWFRPLATWRIWRNDKRTHRKVLVVDDKVAFTGGVGIADEWDGDANTPDEWRDTHCRLRGPAVTGLIAAFLDNWNEAADRWEWQKSPVPASSQSDGVPVQIVRASSTIEWTDTATLLRLLVALARTSLNITTPYFVPDEKTVRLLCASAKRGADVRLLIPGSHADFWMPQYAGHACIGRLLAVGVRVFRYQPTFIHTKCLIVDGLISCIGSANFNHRSMGKDEECCAVVISEAVAGELEAQFREDCENALELSAADWESRGYLARVREKLSRLLIEQF